MRTLTLLLAACSAFGQSSEDRTRQALDQLLAHRFREFYAMFSPQMKNGISLETYSGQMEQILALGAPRKIDEPRSATVGGSVAVPSSADFHKAKSFIVTW
jgi:hypothetical protein